jgi:hypothetical protein
MVLVVVLVVGLGRAGSDAGQASPPSVCVGGLFREREATMSSAVPRVLRTYQSATGSALHTREVGNWGPEKGREGPPQMGAPELGARLRS